MLALVFVISPVLASLAMSPWTNTLERRTGECYVVSLQFPNPALDTPCGTGYVIGNCNCCPNGQIGCLSPAVCTLGSVGNYICAIPSGPGTAQCGVGETPCGARCMPIGADCCGTGATYCPAPQHCGTRPDGSNACFTSVQAATTSSTSTTQVSTKAGTSVDGVQTTTSSSTSTKTAASPTAVSLGAGIQKNLWGAGSAFVMLVVIHF